MTARVLVVEDEPALLRAFTRILEGAGYTVTAAPDGRHAADALALEAFDVIVSDITMPEMSGTQLLRTVRERSSDTPVVLVTANPTVESAIEAVDHGAFRYLIKPVMPQQLLEVVERAAKLHRLDAVNREAAAYLASVATRSEAHAAREASFRGARDTLWMAYQPIVDWPNRRVIAFEALVRSREPTVPHPGALFDLTEQLGRLPELGRAIRDHVARTMAASAPSVDVFVNLHPSDLRDEALYAADAPLSAFADRIVLEITERQLLDEATTSSSRASRLRALGYRIAIDDLGAGYAGLNYVAQLAPQVVKIDMGLVRDIDRDPIKQKLVGALIALCEDLDMLVVTEGIETVEERDTIVGLGGDVMQGFLFASPGRPFPEARW